LLKNYENWHNETLFSPLVSNFPMYKSLDSSKLNNFENAHQIAEQVIFLHIYADLDIEKVNKTIQLIKRCDGKN
tara:strand:- start:1397 stop:1618 length:222 start_codon:yes stop_codon:yes gene_type:complete